MHSANQAVKLTKQSGNMALPVAWLHSQMNVFLGDTATAEYAHDLPTGSTHCAALQQCTLIHLLCHKQHTKCSFFHDFNNQSSSSLSDKEHALHAYAYAQGAGNTSYFAAIPFQKLFGSLRVFMQYTVVQWGSAVGINSVPFCSIL